MRKHAEVLLAIVFTCLVCGVLLLNCEAFVAFDAASYYYQGILIAKGEKPFLAFVENKNPGIYYLLAIPALIFGWNPIGAVLLFRLLDVVLLLLVALLLRRFIVDKLIRLVALICYWSSYCSLFSTTHETIYTEVPAIIGVLAAYNLVLRSDSNSLSDAMTGVLMALAVLFRQTSVVHLLSLLLLFSFEETPRLRMAKSLAGFVGVMVLAAAYASFDGWLMAWWKEAIVWNLDYAQGSEKRSLWSAVGMLFQNDFLFCFALGLVFWLGTAAADYWRKEKSTYVSHLIVALLVMTGSYEAHWPIDLYRHHFISCLPAFTLMTAFALQRCEAICLSMNRAQYLPLTCALLLCTTIVPFYQTFTGAYTKMTAAGERMLTDELGSWLKDNTSDQDSILVWGFAPQIYIAAERRAGSAHFLSGFLTNNGKPGKTADVEYLAGFKADIEKYLPKYIVVLSKIPITEYSPLISTRYKARTLTLNSGTFELLELNST